MTQKSKNLMLIFVVKHRAAKAAADWQEKKPSGTSVMSER